MWHPEHSRAAYPTREAHGRLRRRPPAGDRGGPGAGADTVQLDEPWLATMVDPRFRDEEGITDVGYEMDLCVDLLNQTLDGIDGIATGMHLCHAHFERRHETEGPYDLIMPRSPGSAPARSRWSRPRRRPGMESLASSPAPDSASGASTTATAGSRRADEVVARVARRYATSTRSASPSTRTAASRRRCRTRWTSTRRTRSSRRCARPPGCSESATAESLPAASLRAAGRDEIQGRLPPSDPMDVLCDDLARASSIPQSILTRGGHQDVAEHRGTGGARKVGPSSVGYGTRRRGRSGNVRSPKTRGGPPRRRSRRAPRSRGRRSASSGRSSRSPRTPRVAAVSGRSSTR